MAVLDGSTLPMGWVLQQVLWRRCQIFFPLRPQVKGDPTGTDWELRVDNCPFYHQAAFGFDEAYPVGRQDQVLVFTTEKLYFPIDVDIHQDAYIRDITMRVKGGVTKGPAANFGRYFAVRGIPTWHEELEGIDEPHLIALATMELNPPPGIAALVAGSSLFLDGTSNAGSLAGVL